MPLPLILLGIAACAIAAIVLPTPFRRNGWSVPLMITYSAVWACYLTAALLVTRARALPRFTLAWIVGITVLLHVVVYLQPRPMSTDSYRYLWDGRLVNHGVNPYRYPPEAPQLRFLHDRDRNPRDFANWNRQDFKHVHTMYPPGAEYLFAVLARLRSVDRAAFFWTFIACSVGCTLLLIPLLRLTGRRPEHVIWYAWNPLPIYETAAGGHLDIVGVFFLILALLLIARRQGRAGPASAIAYAASVLCKGPAVIALPCLIARGGWRFAALVVALCGVAFLPFLSAGRHIFDGLGYYFGYWETNSSISFALRALYEWVRGIEVGSRSRQVIATDISVVRAITTLTLAAFIAWQLRRRREDMEWLIAATFGVMAAYLLVGAPVLPWYVAWSLPLLCWWRVPGWTLFSLTVFVQYYARYIAPREWYPLPLLLGYIPVYTLLIWQWTRWRRATSCREATGASAAAGTRW